MFLLDTSAMRALSHTDLQSLVRKGISLCGSPYACWELLCHLDEEGIFSKQKAELLKFQYLNILDDPQIIIESSLSVVHENRVSDVDLIMACLAALQKSNSLDEFYSSYIRDPKGGYREISDLSERARILLGGLETDYVDFVSRLVTHFGNSPDARDISTHPHLIFSMVTGEIGKLKLPNTLPIVPREDAVRCFWIYCGYIFYRSICYVEKGGPVPKNDYEDANICKHLRTDTQLQLVTDDDGTIEALTSLIQSSQPFVRLTLKMQKTTYLKQLARGTG